MNAQHAATDDTPIARRFFSLLKWQKCSGRKYLSDNRDVSLFINTNHVSARYTPRSCTRAEHVEMDVLADSGTVDLLAVRAAGE